MGHGVGGRQSVEGVQGPGESDDLVVKEAVQYFDAMDAEDYSRSVADEATARARAGLLRRRPDLARRDGKPPAVPGSEEAQYALDALAFVREVADRLQSDMTALVFEARRHGASWARVGVAISESPQTAFNRYRRLEEPGHGKEAEARPTRRRPAV